MPTNNPVPSYDPTDLLFNAQKLDEVVNGTSNIFTDRLGVQRRTLAGLSAEFPNASANAAAAAASATDAAEAAQIARDEAVVAISNAAAAQTARTGAEAARDAALIQAGVYQDEPTGRAAVADGVAFKVQGSGDVAAYEYRRVSAATVSTLIATYPSSGAVKKNADSMINKADLVPGKNLFNINSPDVVLGSLVNNATGAIEANVSLNATGYIPVTAGATYALYYKHQIAWYTADKVFISGSPSSDTNKIQTAPAGAAYLRCSVSTGVWSIFQVETGSVVSGFEAYTPAVPATQLPESGITRSKLGYQAVTPSKTNFLLPGKNIFNINDADVLLGYFVSYLNGDIGANVNYNLTGFIPVTAGATYTLSSKNQIAWFDSNRRFISGSSSSDTNKTQTAPAGAKFLRCTVPIASWTTFQVEAGSSQTVFDAYKLNLRMADGTVISPEIPSSSISGDKIVDGAVSIPKTTFFQPGKNKFNKDAATIGYFVSDTGSFGENSYYDVSDYIPVTAGTTYCTNGSGYRFTCFFNSAKAVVAGGSSVVGTTFTAPAGAAYVRVTMYHANLQTYQVEVGSSATAFESYGYVLKQDGGPPIRIDPVSNPISLPSPEMVLPPYIFGVQGRECNVYFDNLMLGTDLLEFDVSSASSTGQQQTERWTWTPGAAITTGSLAISAVEKRTGAIVTSKSANQRAAASTAGSGLTKKVLVIGDSLVNAGVITQTLLDIAGTDVMGVTLLGTRGSGLNKHEGRGGWTINDYTSAGPTYRRFTVSGVVQAPTSASTEYSDGAGTIYRVQEVAISGGSGTIDCSVVSGPSTPAASGTLTKSNGGAGDATLVYSATTTVTGNPFWIAGAVNFGQYLTNNSIPAPDWVMIGLGINDCFSQTDDAACSTLADTELAKLDSLIASIKSADANTKIGLMIPSPPSADQDSFGANYATGQTRWRFKRNILIWARQMIAKYTGQEASRVYLVPSNTALDTVNNMSTAAAAPVNSRSTVTKARQNNGVHPGTTGYQQIGDAVWAFLKYYA